MTAQTAARRERRSALLLACAATGTLLVLVPSSLGFVGSGAAPQPESDATLRGSEAVVARRELLQWMPAAALAAGAAPSFGASGVTTAWKTKPDGSEDEIHTGGVTWEDVKIGTGSTPKIGQLVAINFIAKCVIREKEIIIEDTKGTSKDYRFGIGQMLPGMDEGVLGMRTGGVRVMQIPGNLAFGAKAVPAAVGRPQVPSYTPIEVTVTLDFIPGADSVYEYGTEDEK